MDKIFLTAAAGIGALFGNGGNGGDSKMPPPVRNEVRNEVRIRATTAPGSFDVSCVATAVAAREAALAAAATANAQALTSAYSDRGSALASAYAQTGNDVIRKAVKNAWNKFNAALRLAHRGWKTAQQSAWTQFRTAVKACGAGAASIADSSNASMDASAGAGSD